MSAWHTDKNKGNSNNSMYFMLLQNYYFATMRDSSFWLLFMFFLNDFFSHSTNTAKANISLVNFQLCWAKLSSHYSKPSSPAIFHLPYLIMHSDGRRTAAALEPLMAMWCPYSCSRPHVMSSSGNGKPKYTQTPHQYPTYSLFSSTQNALTMNLFCVHSHKACCYFE